MAIKDRAKRIWTPLKDTIDLWTSKNAFQFSGAIAFYTVFSLAPLMVILVSVTGMIFGEDAARGEISGQIEALVGPQAAEAVETAVDQSRIEQSGILPTLLGVGALLFGATTVFAQVQAALNHIWGVRSRPSRSGIVSFARTRILSLGLVLALGFLLLVSFALTMAIGVIIRHASDWMPVPNLLAMAADLVITLTVVTLLFATIFRVLPDVNLGWRDMWRGAFFSATLFAIGQYAISVYLTQTAPGSAYGAAGSLVLVLMWVYYSSLILLLGAAFTRISVRSRGGMIEPRDMAVKVHTEIIEDGPESSPA